MASKRLPGPTREPGLHVTITMPSARVYQVVTWNGFLLATFTTSREAMDYVFGHGYVLQTG